jgi:hypothetical protein
LTEISSTAINISHTLFSIIPALPVKSPKTGPSAVWRSNITVAGYQKFDSMSFVTPTEFWMRNECNLYKIDRNGNVICNIESLKIHKDFIHEHFDLHTVTQKGELLFLGDKYIKKLTSQRTVTTLITGDPEAEFTAICSCSNGDILAVMKFNDYSKILRVSEDGISAQVNKEDDEGKDIYNNGRYFIISESKKNEAILTSNGSEVICVDKTGRYEFSYKGHFSEKDFAALSVSTDSLGQILVGHNNHRGSSIHLLEEDGTFLCFLLTNKKDGIHSPLSICACEGELYVLCEGSNKISVYDYQPVKDRE